MRYIKYRSIVFLTVLICSLSSKAQELTEQQYKEDIDFFGRELASRHKNLFAKISVEDFRKKLHNVEGKPLTKQNLVIHLLQVIKEVGDEHTMIFQSNYPLLYPLRFDLFKEGIYVVATDSSHSDLLYRQLQGIDGHSTKAIVEDLKTLVKEGNPSYYDVYLMLMLRNPTILNGIGITDSDLKADFIFGGTRHIFFPSKQHKVDIDSKLLRYSKGENYWYSLIDDQKTIYFNYQKCDQQPGKPFDVFAQQLFQEIAATKPKRMIIDLRNNSGGNSGILQSFLDKLKDSHLKKKGSLYVLIGKNTFSSALTNAVDLKRNFNAILVGEPTSGNVNHYGEIRGFQLPHSELEIGYSTRYWEVWKGYEGALKPDHAITYSIYNFKKGKDEAIDYILNAKKTSSQRGN